MVLEHRYYGDSQPSSDEQGGWSYDNLQWLNAPQALADIAHFIDSTNEDLVGHHDWVVIGGSYPGALSAWFKSQYPNHAAAAWSSSGVIHAIEDFDMMDFDTFTSTNKSVQGPACVDAIRNATLQIDWIFTLGSAD